MANSWTHAKNRARQHANTYGHCWFWNSPFPNDWKTNPAAVSAYYKEPYQFAYNETGIRPDHVPKEAHYRSRTYWNELQRETQQKVQLPPGTYTVGKSEDGTLQVTEGPYSGTVIKL